MSHIVLACEWLAVGGRGSWRSLDSPVGGTELAGAIRAGPASHGLFAKEARKRKKEKKKEKSNRTIPALPRGERGGGEK